MQFYSRFCRAKLRPPENIQAQIDNGGIKSIDLSFQFKINQVIVSTQNPGLFDELQSKVAKDAPIPAFIGT